VNFRNTPVFSVRPGNSNYKNNYKCECENYFSCAEHITVANITPNFLIFCFYKFDKLIKFNFLRKRPYIFLRYFFFVSTIYSSNIFAWKPQSSFLALSVHDYFKAKKLFYGRLEKNNDAYACYGLATIYSRNNNPFYDLDSASKYAEISFNSFRVKPIKQTFSGFIIDSVSILNLCDTIAMRSFRIIPKNNSIIHLDKFMKQNYLCDKNLILMAQRLRDEQEFKHNLFLNSSDSTIHFILTHPQSDFLAEAGLLKDHQLFEEQTKNKSERQYLSFITKYPENIMLNSAYEALYNIYKNSSDTAGLKNFVNNFPKSPQITEAWKLLFSLSVKSFSNAELEKFLQEHPKFPFKNSILKELELNKFALYPYQKEDFFGFIDSTAKIVINPFYDVVSQFSEGLAVVNNNDSVFFINKENRNVFNLYFSDAYPFKNGIAAIKQNLPTGLSAEDKAKAGQAGNKWGFINRQGQATGTFYDEISELSNNAYVVKLNNKYGAIDYFGRVIIEPRFDKLGDFKNEIAYYIENGKYGFVLKNGYIQKAEFDWISDFNENNIAVIKQNNFYGLINSQGKKILEPQYDQILKAPKNIFILVKNSIYGFFNGDGCYLSAMAFDFLKEKPAEFYTNGNVLKLLRKNEEALMDLNGKLSMEFGTYDEINFASNSLIKVKKKNKYGFIDKKLNVVIPYKYEQAGDFLDSLAVVKLKNKSILINTAGKEIFSAEGTITKISSHYYLVEGAQKDFVNHKGEKIFVNIGGIQKPNNRLIIITLNNNETRSVRD